MKNKFPKIGPMPQKITLIDKEKCPLPLLLACVIPNDARIHIELKTERKIKIISGPHYVRGVGISFYEVEFNKHLYFVAETYIRGINS